MIEFLIRRFVPDWQQVQRTDVRERYGTLAAAVGILSNIFLCIIKGLIGLFSGSIAVTARRGQQPVRRRLLGHHPAGL